MELSVILPNFNSKKLALKNLAILREYLSTLETSFEIILVDDGSVPQERISSAEAGPFIQIIQLPKNIGKGNAVKRGMLAASGNCCVFTDIDLPYDLTAIAYALKLINQKGLDCVVGNRTLSNSVDVTGRPLVRKLASRVFSKAISLLIVGGIVDSQCGFKAFSGRLAKAIFPLITINRFSFDIEIFYLLLKYNILFKLIPVRLQRHDVSTVNLLTSFLQMAPDAISIPFKWYQGRYFSKELQDFYYEDRYWE